MSTDKIDKRPRFAYLLVMAKLKTNADAYEDVLRHFYVNGKRHGAKQRLADALSLSSRAVTDRWQRYGIPMKYAPALKKTIGMEPEQIWPENYR
jgi:hypothetical protein